MCQTNTRETDSVNRVFDDDVLIWSRIWFASFLMMETRELKHILLYLRILPTINIWSVSISHYYLFVD